MDFLGWLALVVGALGFAAYMIRLVDERMAGLSQRQALNNDAFERRITALENNFTGNAPGFAEGQAEH